MAATMDFYTALNAVKKVLTADFACGKDDFDNDGVFIHPAKEMTGRRRFPFREKSLSIATMGRGVAVSCSVDKLGWCDANLSGLSRNEIFAPPAIKMMDEFVKKDGQYMAGPDLKYICTKNIFNPFNYNIKGVEITLANDTSGLKLDGDPRFLNSLGRGNNPLTPRVVAAVARCKGQIAGIASASADCDSMWRIGVDTAEEYRNRGIGKAMVSRVTEVILAAGKIPYYSALESDTASKALAASLGYKTTWIEIYAREKTA